MRPAEHGPAQIAVRRSTAGVGAAARRSLRAWMPAGSEPRLSRAASSSMASPPSLLRQRGWRGADALAMDRREELSQPRAQVRITLFDGNGFALFATSALPPERVICYGFASRSGSPPVPGEPQASGSDHHCPPLSPWPKRGRETCNLRVLSAADQRHGGGLVGRPDLSRACSGGA